MYQAWIARNDAMAQSIVNTLEANPQNPVVMIVGFGHLRHGMGIPERVAYLHPATKQINFTMFEISQEPSSLDSYLPEFEINGKTFRLKNQVFTDLVKFSMSCGQNRFQNQLLHQA